MEQRIHTIDALKGIGIMGIVLVHTGGGGKTARDTREDRQ